MQTSVHQSVHRLYRSGVCLAILLFLIPAQVNGQNFSFLGPDVVVQGKSFSGLVIDDTEDTPEPLPDDATVVIDQDTFPAGPSGSVPLPPITVAGNVFRQVEVLDPEGNAMGTTNDRHFESVPLRFVPDRPVISRTQDVIQADGLLIVEGSGLDGIMAPTLVDDTGRTFQLTKIFGSDLQNGYWIPSNLPDGEYTFSARDKQGNDIKSPDKSTAPTLDITGPSIKRRGSRGKLRIRSSASGLLALHIPEGVIRLMPAAGIAQRPDPNGTIFNLLNATAGKWIEVPFQAENVGEWTATVYSYSAGRIPDHFKGPAVEPQALGTPRCQYDPIQHQTLVTQDFVLTRQDDATAVADAHVDFIISDPAGVNYQTTMTNTAGRTRVQITRPGKLSPEEVYIGPYHTWEYQYKPAPKEDLQTEVSGDCPCEGNWLIGPRAKIVSYIAEMDATDHLKEVVAQFEEEYPKHQNMSLATKIIERGLAAQKDVLNDDPPDRLSPSKVWRAFKKKKDHKGFMTVHPRICCSPEGEIEKYDNSKFLVDHGYTVVGGTRKEPAILSYGRGEKKSWVNTTVEDQDEWTPCERCILFSYRHKAQMSALAAAAFTKFFIADPPHIVTQIDYKLCCDGTYDIRFYGTEFPSHKGYINNQSDWTISRSQNTDMMPRFMFSSNHSQEEREELETLIGSKSGKINQ